MKKFFSIIFAISVALTLASCAKEVLSSDQTISGRYVPDEGTDLSDQYIAFEGGKFLKYTATSLYTVAEDFLWHCDKSSFTNQHKTSYCIMDGVLYLNSQPYAEISLKDKILTIGKDKYFLLEGFYADYYSSISTKSTSMVVPYQTTNQQVEVTVNKPIRAGKLSATSTTTWLSDVGITDGKLTFVVAETKTYREGSITIRYTNARDYVLNIVQAPSTFIRLTSTIGETDYHDKTTSFACSIENPIESSSLSINCEQQWVKDIAFDGSKVEFKLEENQGNVDRKAYFKLSYSGAEDVYYTLTQKWATTTIELTPSSATPSYTGGNASFTYTITNPRSGASLKASSNAIWITGVTVADNKVSYTVAENNSTFSRSSSINLTYGSFASQEFKVSQTGRPVTSIQISKTSLTLTAGQSETLSATVVPSDAELAWESSNTTVASVDKSGKVSALAIGSAVITVKAGDKSSQCSLTVNGKTNELTLTPSWTESTGLTYGNSGTISISNPSGGQLSISSAPSSSIATASAISSPTSSSTSIKITPIAAGETSISIKSAATSQYVESTKTIQIKVLKATPSFSISPTILKLEPNGTSGQILITSNSDCTFTASSSNASVSTVSVSGKTVNVQPYNEGTATITVNCPGTSRYEEVSSLQCSVIVRDAVDLSSLGTANCYIVSSSGDYKFKATVKGNSTQSVGTPTSASVLWESFGTSSTPSVGGVVANVSYSSGYVKFSTPSTLNNGNAVIAVKDVSGNILWSWHIWVCKDFDPVKTAQVYKNSAGTLMDRNLGATSATPGDVHALGLLYQWGRKDPFLSGNSITSSTVAASTLSWPSPVSSNSTNGTISYAVSHPTTFITYNSRNFDWYYTGSSSTDNTRWQTSDKTKGMYDPCPAGWRVPDGSSNGVWSKAFGSSLSYSSGPWDSTNKGMNFGSGNGQSSSHQLGSASTIWYPAAGYRYSYVGSLSNVGYYGRCWSCTPSGNYAYNLSFGSDGDVKPSGSGGYRAYGLSVRCLSE